MNSLVLNDKEFSLFQNMIYETAGISLSNAKKTLVTSRLSKRVIHHGLTSFGEYFKFIKNPVNNELQTAIDLLTTNETYFFREPKHFDFLRDKIMPIWRSAETRRVWSAASSSGEEAYTIAMMLAEHSPTKNYEIVGTDISYRMVEQARTGIYPIMRAEKIPTPYLSNSCLKGTGSQLGSFIINKALRQHVSFIHANLKDEQSKLGKFDIIFLRNVLIYFDMETKQHVISNLVKQLKSGGFLMIGHSESLNGINNDLLSIAPSIYRKP